ncbi:MAG: glutathione S-transferase family protein [Dongiaceae bacterium]
MSIVEIIGLDASTFVRTALMACAEKGIEHRLVPGPLAKGDLKSPEFLALNPYGRMPVMRHGNLLLFETSAILRYLEDRFGGRRLIPTNPEQAALAEQWTSAIGFSGYRNLVIGYLFHYIFPKGADGAPDRAAIEGGLPAMRRELEILNGGLAQGTFFCGSEPTMPDLFLVPILDYVRRMPEGTQAMAERPGLLRLMSAFEDRESYRTTIPERLKKAA